MGLLRVCVEDPTVVVERAKLDVTDQPDVLEEEVLLSPADVDSEAVAAVAVVRSFPSGWNTRSFSESANGRPEIFSNR